MVPVGKPHISPMMRVIVYAEVRLSPSVFSVLMITPAISINGSRTGIIAEYQRESPDLQPSVIRGALKQVHNMIAVIVIINKKFFIQDMYAELFYLCSYY